MVNVLGYFQRIGRALMLPVATLPAAAILMGIGYWIDPNGWGGGNAAAAFLIKAGGAIIQNMSWLFAVGVAYGMSRDKDGAAALAGLVGFLVVKSLCSPDAVSLILSIPLQVADVAKNATMMNPQLVPFTNIENQFIGILVGVISAHIYNRFYQVELPKALSFFNGRRLVPIVTSVVMMALAAILMFTWPWIYNGLVGFGEHIQRLGATGAGIYAFFNRLLIPIGLHHALNSVFWFNVAGINDIPNFLGGAQSIAAGTGIPGVTGMYQAGFFPIMMFGLPGAALAIYHCARPENKAKVASIMLAAAFASCFTGVTEPLEFSFMFVAPLLYVLHSLLTGLSVFIAAAMHWMAGFGFSAGLVDMVLSARNPLAVHWYMLIVQGLVFFVLYYVLFRMVIVRFNLMTPGRDTMEDETPEVAALKSDKLALAQAYIDAAGGAGNIVSIDACISRLRLSVQDADAVDDRAAKRLGASGVIRPNNHSVQIVVGAVAESIADAMKQVVKMDPGSKAN